MISFDSRVDGLLTGIAAGVSECYLIRRLVSTSLVNITPPFRLLKDCRVLE